MKALGDELMSLRNHPFRFAIALSLALHAGMSAYLVYSLHSKPTVGVSRHISLEGSFVGANLGTHPVMQNASVSPKNVVEGEIQAKAPVALLERVSERAGREIGHPYFYSISELDKPPVLGDEASPVPEGATISEGGDIVVKIGLNTNGMVLYAKLEQNTIPASADLAAEIVSSLKDVRFEPGEIEGKAVPVEFEFVLHLDNTTVSG